MPQVTLWNTGENAFQPDAYGNWITIERVIKAAGGTQYKIYSSAGKRVRNLHLEQHSSMVGAPSQLYGCKQ
jgi:hypothetical protein